MNKPLTRLLPLALVALFLLGGLLPSLTSCQRQTTSSKGVKDSLNALLADSMIYQRKKLHNPEALMALIDSLEEVGIIGVIQANYERGYVCKDQGQQRQSENYWKKAVNGEIRNLAEDRAGFLASAMLTNL